MEATITFVGLGAMFVFMGVLIARSVRRDREIRAGFRAYAEAQGLTHDYRKVRGKGAEAAFADPQQGMTLIVQRRHAKQSGNSRSRSGGSAVVQFDDPRLPGGIVIYTREMQEGLAQAASTFAGLLDNKIGKRLVGRLLGDDIGAHLGEVDEQPVPPGLDLTILASVDPAPWFDAAAAERALVPFSEGEQPMVMITGNGLQLRLAREVTEPEALDRLIDTARRLKAEIRR
ncbi:hypothetical protein [Pararhodobacter marinus]|uniref:hypothetical protein n=1 Tax=Pararhodobacter marinus TaxID=2184063 RepID=UPI003512086D